MAYTGEPGEDCLYFVENGPLGFTFPDVSLRICALKPLYTFLLLRQDDALAENLLNGKAFVQAAFFLSGVFCTVLLPKWK